MKLKKAGLLLGIVPLLISCSKDPYAGTYVFQMGKNKDTHLAVSLELTKNLFDEANPDKGKKFILDFDMLTSEVDDGFSAILKELTPLDGYYKVDKSQKVYDETRLNIGLNFLGEYELPGEVTEMIFVASITSSFVNFYLPVSIEDLQFQLYWYGYDLTLANILADMMSEEEGENQEGQEGQESEKTDTTTSVDGFHPLGTHPSKEDVAKINEHYKDSHNGKEFRDFHVLKLGLTKQ